MPNHSLEVLATVLFAAAVLHTFAVKAFQSLARRYPEGSVGENLFHLLGEVEVVFGLWAFAFLAVFAATEGVAPAIAYLESRNFSEAAFVFVIMAVCATRPITELAGLLMAGLARGLPLRREAASFVVILIVGPLLGSLITEPAAMTVTALLLLEKYFRYPLSPRFKYAILGTLFVNVSIGGTLTHFAAPPVLMVAGKWGWDLEYMLRHFGWKGALAVVVSTVTCAIAFRRELSALRWNESGPGTGPRTPAWIFAAHLLALAGIVAGAHHVTVFMGLFLFFLGLVNVTREYQSPLKLKEGLLVGFFLAGLVVLGGMQRWWIEPLLTELSAFALFTGATALTAVTDNAALTYLGSLVPSLTDAAKYALVAGAVTGGGLTVIANAPNPAGYSLLNRSFGKDGIQPLGLFLGALGPTVLAALSYWLFRHAP